MLSLRYDNTPIKRRLTGSVNIGGVPMGSNYPIRIQSMTNTLTGDISGSVEQCIRIINAGADYVRLTVPSLSDVESFAAVKQKLHQQGYTTPLIADVHFNPDIALEVADYADKVRINPGNFADREKFISLLEKCHSNGVAIRIGVNHGSLSERIMDKFGDSPAGMAESAMEFLRICRERHFDQVVVSMKASNVKVMVYATRLTAFLMEKENMNFPLHLGVTEAGEGEDGRIKSAVGIGTLLSEGLGDTIRVSLTEDPEAEIPVAQKLIEHIKQIYGDNVSRKRVEEENRTQGGKEKMKFVYSRRKTRITGNIGGNMPPVVVGVDDLDHINLTKVSSDELTESIIKNSKTDKNAVLLYEVKNLNIQAEIRWLHLGLNELKCRVPVIFRLNSEEKKTEDFILKSAASLGGAFIDGFGDGIWLTNNSSLNKEFMNSVALGILQACRARMTKTEYISCPSCGRTHFDLMATLAKIKEATVHLKGLKIGVMGCIVNGPGEMADADYGYVGAGKGKITLYKAKEIVKKNIAEEFAVEELINLIKENGDWVEA